MLQVLLEEYGMSMSVITASFLSYNDGFSQLADGNVDVAMALAGYPTAAVVQLTATHKIKPVKIDPAKLASISKKHPYYSDAVVPKDVYKLSEDAVMMAAGNTLVVRSNLDENTVFKITKAVFDNLKEFADANANAKQIDPARAHNVPLPLHAGAAKYFKK